MKSSSSLPLLMLAALAACSNTTEVKPVLDESPRWANVGKSCDDNAPAVLLSSARHDSLPAEYLGPPDRKWAALARTAPGGIGGIYAAGPNYTEYFVLLTDPAKKVEAFAAIRAAFPGIETSFPLERAQVAKGRWDFAQLGDWYGYLLMRGAFRVATSSDIDEKGNRLDFGVPDEAARATLEAWLTSLDVPCRLVAIHIQPPIEAL